METRYADRSEMCPRRPAAGAGYGRTGSDGGARGRLGAVDRVAAVPLVRELAPQAIGSMPAVDRLRPRR
jgi:hypothetical protein